MYSKAKAVRIVTVSALFIAGLTACVKQRPEQIRQDHILTQSLRQNAPLTMATWKFNANSNTFLKKTDHTLTTAPGKPLFKSQNSVAQQLNVEPEAGFRFLDVRNFKSTHPLLDGKAEIAYVLGEENKTYPIIEELTPTHLILYKVVSDDELSFNERTIAKSYEGKWRIPVGGYEVTYLRRQRVLNEDNRETNLVDFFTVPARDFKTATDFRVDEFAFIPFDRFVKTDVMLKDFFSSGEWYFSETTVEVRHDGMDAVGDLGGADSNFLSASRVKFCFFDDQMVALNTNVDDEFKDIPCNINHNVVMRFAVEHRDFTWVNTGPNALKEIEDEVEDKLSKQYVKILFLKSETIQTSLANFFQSILGSVQNFRSINDVTYGKDYFSFSVRDAVSEKIVRYSFRKVDPTKKITPRLAFRDDSRIFGTFATRKYKKNDYEIARLSDVENLLLMARHNPDKDVVYFFTKQTPCEDPRSSYCVNYDPSRSFDPNGKWFRDIGRSSIDLWNQAFIKAGLKIRIRLDESKDVDLGDIRYNVLNIVNRAGQGLLGFGPSLIDTETGEIVSASMNTGVENILNQNFFSVRDYLSRQSGYHYNFKNDEGGTNLGERLPNLIHLIQQANSGLYRVDAKTGDILLNGETHLNPAAMTEREKEFLSYLKIPLNAKASDFIERITAMRLHSHRYNLPSIFGATLFNERDANFTSTQVVDAAIAKNCPEVVALAEKMKSTPLLDTATEVQIIEPCARLLAQGEAVLTTVHELGHNLSLRHNFRGSVDHENYPKLSDYQVKYVKVAEGLAKPMTSSIMEYTTSEGQQLMPGNYDVAAIRWIYKGEVPLKNGTLTKVPENKKIADVVPVDSLKPYQFCTDEQRILITDPLCIAFDNGTNAHEIVRFQIEEIYNSLGYTYRYDRRGASFGAFNLAVRGRLMKSIYDQWRGFLRKYTGVNKSYLQGYDINSYNDLIEGIRARGGKEAAELEEHLKVRNMIVRFLVDMAFISNKYCVVKDDTNNEKLIELEKIRKELFGIGDFSIISSCQSPSAAKYLTENGYVYVREFGHFLDAGRFDQNPNKLEFQDIFSDTNPLDFSGTSSVRSVAMLLLTMRDAPSINNILDGFFPSLLDEPDLRNYLQFLILDRIVNGVRMAHDNSKSEYSTAGSELFNSSDIVKVQKQKAYINFESEAELVQFYSAIMADNLWMPGAQDDGRRSYVNVSVGDPSQIENIKQIADDYYEYLDRVLYVRNRNSFAGQVMGRFKFLNNQKSRMQIKPDAIAASRLSVMTELTKAGVLFQPLKNHTVLDLINFAMAANSLLEKLFSDQNTLAAGYSLMNIVNTEFALMDGFMQNLQAQGLTLEQLMAMYESKDTQEKAAADKILLQPIGPIYEQYKQQDPTLGQPTLAEMNKRFDAFLKSHTDEYNNFSRSALEYDSQIDLLQRIIQILSR